MNLALYCLNIYVWCESIMWLDKFRGQPLLLIATCSNWRLIGIQSLVEFGYSQNWFVVANPNSTRCTVEWIGSGTGTTVEDPPSKPLQLYTNLKREGDCFMEECDIPLATAYMMIGLHPYPNQLIHRRNWSWIRCGIQQIRSVQRNRDWVLSATNPWRSSVV
jgi:hypothetical protein